MGRKQNQKEPKNNIATPKCQTTPQLSSNTRTKVEIYNFVQFIHLTVGYSSGIQNAWISLLMIAFGTTFMMERFVWLIPLFIRLLIQPYVYNYIVKSKYCKVYLKTKVIAVLFLLSLIGVGFVIYSSFISEKDYLKRIIICTIGWTTIGLCLGIATYLSNQLKSVIQEDPLVRQIIKPTEKTHENQSSVQKQIKIVWHQLIRLKLKHFRKRLSYNVLGQTLGYLGSFFICLFHQGDSFAEFYKLNNIMYATCVVSQLYVFIFLMWKAARLQQKFEKYPKKRQKVIKIFQGLIKLTKADLKQRTFLTIHFIVTFMIDFFVILTTYWVGVVYRTEFGEGKTYCYGVRIGSAYLVIFMLISNTKLPKVRDWHIQQTLKFFKHYSIFYLVTGVACFCIFEEKIILAFVLSGAVMVSIYRNKIYPQMMKEDMFQSCVGTVEKLEKVFRVSFFPLFISVAFRQNALTSNSTWVTLFFLSILLIGILIFVTDSGTSKYHKRQLTTEPNKQKFH